MSYSDQITTNETLIQIKTDLTQQLKKEEELVKHSNKTNQIKKILLISVPRLTIKQLNDTFQSTVGLGTQSKPMDKTHYEVYPPLGLFYLSSMFKEKNDVDVQIFDMHLHCIQKLQNNEAVDWKEIIDDAINKSKPDLVGLSKKRTHTRGRAALPGLFFGGEQRLAKRGQEATGRGADERRSSG